MTGFAALMARDLRLVWRRPGDVAVVLAFFVVATVLFPLGIGPEANLLARIAAGVLWCAALFAALLSLDRLFAADYEDGTLDLLLLAPWPLELAALAKCAAHWIVTGLPLAVLAPLPGRRLRPRRARASLALGATLLVGTPTLSLVGGLAAALTLGARRSGALLALLALPLCVPTLIFGASARRNHRHRRGFRHASGDPGGPGADLAGDPAVGDCRSLAASGRVIEDGRIEISMADLHFLANPARFRRFSQRVLPVLSRRHRAGARGRSLSRAGRLAARLPAGRDGAHHVRARAVGLDRHGGLHAAGGARRLAAGVAPSAGRADGARRGAGRRRASARSACSPARCGAGRCGAPTGCGMRGSPRCCCCSSSISATSRLSRAYDDPGRGDRAAAILALVGAINVPIIKFSVDWWNTLHQPASVMKLGGPSIHPAILTPLLVMAVALLLLYVVLVLLRTDTEIDRRRLELARPGA